MPEEPKPVTVESATRAEVCTAISITGRVIRANGDVEELGVLGEWRPPLSYRIGAAVRRFVAGVETELERDGFVLSFGMRITTRLVWRSMVHSSRALARAAWRWALPRRK